MSLSDNLVLSRHGTDRLDRYGMVNFRWARRLSDEVVSKFDVRISGKNPLASSLSGGNLQKFVVGREILARPGVLVVDQPTWGVDAGAAVAIRQALINLAAQGAAVLVISQDLDELFSISDRIAVLHEGSLSAALPTGQVTRDTIGLMMAGSEVDDAA
jgi:simple sugar transport system ATP-binding protein